MNNTEIWVMSNSEREGIDVCIDRAIKEIEQNLWDEWEGEDENNNWWRYWN